MSVRWFGSAVRIAGSAFPVTSALVQLQAEVDATEFERRLSALEDPIGQIHPKLSELCEYIYAQLSNSTVTSPKIELQAEQYAEYGKPLAAIEASGFIKGSHAIGKQFAGGFYISDPTFMLYIQARFGESEPMDRLGGMLENTKVGDQLSGHTLASELQVPLPIVHAMFETYESKG
jgi:hypothetical protein